MTTVPPDDAGNEERRRARPSVTVIASCAGGGPTARLARHLDEPTCPCRLLAGSGSDRWRAQMGKGALGRLGYRAWAFLLFPMGLVLHGVFRAPRVMIPTTNPFILPWIAIGTRWLHGRPVIPLVYDLYPDALEAGGVVPMGGFVSRMVSGINRWWIRRADGVVYIGRRMAEHAHARYGEPRLWTILETGADAEELDSQTSTTWPSSSALGAWCEDRYVVSYVGNLGVMHDWETLAEAVPKLLAEQPGSARKLGVVIAAFGPGEAWLRDQWGDSMTEHVIFTGSLQDEEWAALLARSDVSLATLRQEANRTCVPSKAYSAMAAGSALVVVAPEDSDLAELVQARRCGRVTAPGDVDGLVAALGHYGTDAASCAEAAEAGRQAIRAQYDIRRLADRWRVFLQEVLAQRSASRRPSPAKRLVDFTLALLGLLASAPVLLFISVAVAAVMGRPVLFRQSRPGRGGAPFPLTKFRTMRAPSPGEEAPEHDALRLTGLGRFLRATSLDELPTLWNVLMGHMSLVGPRPLLAVYLDRYSPYQARRHDMKPGITGWAQVHGRNAIDWDERLRLDVWYVDNWSHRLDMGIMLSTLWTVVTRSGINREGFATMPEFRGSAPDGGEQVQDTGPRHRSS